MRLEELKTFLISQKYPKETVTQEIKKELIILFEVLNSEKAKESKRSSFYFYV